MLKFALISCRHEGIENRDVFVFDFTFLVFEKLTRHDSAAYISCRREGIKMPFKYEVVSLVSDQRFVGHCADNADDKTALPVTQVM